ncbi:MAG: chemotaxis protein CheX [Actinomycetota bacterium]
MSTVDLSEPGLLDELVEIVSEMLDGVVEASVPDGHVQPVMAYESQTAQAAVDVLIDTDVACTLTIRLQASVAVGLAAVLTDEDPADLVAEDACEVLSELTNVLGGSVKSLVEEETSLGIPKAEVKETGDFDVLDGSVFVDHQLGVFQVRLGQ